MTGGTFAISLDFALHWKSHHRATLSAAHKKRIEETYNVIPALLNTFRDNVLHVTWNTVGFIFCRNTAELRYYFPKVLPQYRDRRLNPYLYLPNTDRNPSLARYYYAPQLIEQIQHCPNQEIASLSLSHYNTAVKGASLDSFLADLMAAKQIAQRFNIDLKSYAFPNQRHPIQYVEQLAALGIQCFRGHTSCMTNTTTAKQGLLSPLKRGLYFLDSAYNIAGHHTCQPIIMRDGEYPIINIPASRFFEPYCTSVKLNRSRLQRIMQSMTHAAQHNRVFHLWWHPEDFSSNLSENLNRLEMIIEHYYTLKVQYGMVNHTMQEIAQAYPIPCVHAIHHQNHLETLETKSHLQKSFHQTFQ